MKFGIWQFILLISVMAVSTMAAGCSFESSTSPQAAPTATPSPGDYNPANSINVPTISAMEGFPLAEKEALSWRKDATSGSIIGTAIDPNEKVPIDGKTTKWTYFFSSPSSKNDSLIVIVYGDGRITNSEKVITTSPNPGGLGYSGEVDRIAGWKVDSTQAVQTALRLYRTKYGVDADSAGYVLTDSRASGKNGSDFYWEIGLFGPPDLFTGNEMTVYVDPTTGDVIAGPHSTAK